MKTRKLNVISLFLTLVLALLPLQAAADDEEIVWTPIKSGETVSGTASYGYSENYAITADYAGELVLEMDFTAGLYVKIQNVDGKPFAPTDVEFISRNYAHGMGATSYYFSGPGEAVLTYNVQPGEYHITAYEAYSTNKAASFQLIVSTPLQSTATATPNRSTVLVNGQNVSFDAYTINDNNYFKLRDLAQVLRGTGKQFEVTWDGEKNAINMLSNTPYTTVGGEMAPGDGVDKTARLNASAIYLDEEAVRLGAYTIDDNNYFKLRDIGRLFDFDVTWDGVNNTILVDTTRSYTAD